MDNTQIQSAVTKKRYFYGHELSKGDPEYQFLCFTIGDAFDIIKKHEFWRNDWVIGVFKNILQDSDESNRICSLQPKAMMLEWERVLQGFKDLLLIKDPLSFVDQNIDLRTLEECDQQLIFDLEYLYDSIAIQENQVLIGIPPDNRNLIPCPKTIANRPVAFCLSEWNRLTSSDGTKAISTLPDPSQYFPIKEGRAGYVRKDNSSKNNTACGSLRVHIGQKQFTAVSAHSANSIGQVERVYQQRDCKLIELPSDLESLNKGPYLRAGIPQVGKKYCCVGNVSGLVRLQFMLVVQRHKLQYYLFRIEDKHIHGKDTQGNCGSLIFDESLAGTVYGVWHSRPSQMESSFDGYVAAIAIHSFLPPQAKLLKAPKAEKVATEMPQVSGAFRHKSSK